MTTTSHTRRSSCWWDGLHPISYPRIKLINIFWSFLKISTLSPFGFPFFTSLMLSCSSLRLNTAPGIDRPSSGDSLISDILRPCRSSIALSPYSHGQWPHFHKRICAIFSCILEESMFSWVYRTINIFCKYLAVWICNIFMELIAQLISCVSLPA